MSDGGVPAPRPGEYFDDGSPVDSAVCNPHRVVVLLMNALAAEGYDVRAPGGQDAVLGATLLIRDLGLTPRVPGDPQ